MQPIFLLLVFVGLWYDISAFVLSTLQQPLQNGASISFNDSSELAPLYPFEQCWDPKPIDNWNFDRHTLPAADVDCEGMPVPSLQDA